MIGPARPLDPCARFAAELPGFADHSLPPQRADQVGGHVASCARCLEEVTELRRVRELLGSHAAQASSAGLSSRLLSIAGDQSAAPLWLQAGGGVTALPSKRAQRRRRVGVAALSSTAAVLVLLTLALLMAPDLRLVTDSERLARQDFSASVAALGMDEPVAAVLFALDRGATFERVAGFEATNIDDTDLIPMAASRAQELLDAARCPEHSTGGTQRVLILDGEQYLDARVRVHDDPARGVAMTVLDAAGKEFLSGSVAAADVWSSSSVSLGLDYYVSSGTTGPIAGKAAVLIEARDGGFPVARWWLSRADGSLLWSERYDVYGRVAVASGYESIEPMQITAAGKAAAAPNMALLPAAHEQRAGDWCHGWSTCPLELAGLPLVAYASSGPADATVMHLVYSDGLTTLSVVRQPGLLAPDGVVLTEYSRSDVPVVRAWQSGGAVVVVATNGPASVVQAARGELPSEPAARPDTWWRLRTGFERLIGAGIR